MSIGRALRPLATELVSDRLTSFVDRKSEENGNLFLEVSIPIGGASIIDCQWTSPDGTIYFVDEDAAVGNDGKDGQFLFNVILSIELVGML